MNHCVALVTDLIFSTKVRGTAKDLGVGCRIVGSLAALEEALLAEAASTVIVDLNADGVGGAEAIRVAKRACPMARVLAYLSHVQAGLAAEARGAGADEVMPRSVFVERLPELLVGP